MHPSSLRLHALLLNQYICPPCRKATQFARQPSYRPIHASPIVQRPRRRDFFSSNSLLSSSKASSPDDSKDGLPGGAGEQSQLQKRKSARSPVAKTSLRRAAIEAQRSKDGALARTRGPSEDATGPKPVSCYAVAEQFDVAKVVEILRSKGYEPDPLETRLYPQVVHIQIPLSSIYRSSNRSVHGLSPAEVGDVFIFPSGTLVSWGLPEGFTSYFATRTLLPSAENPHTDSIETEDLDYVEDPSRETSSIRGDTIILGTKSDSATAPQSSLDTVLTKIAFSSGFARSTKLAVLETLLSSYLSSTSLIPTYLSRGGRLPLAISRSFILRKTGTLLSLRAQLNLYSELTDSLPDLFWDDPSPSKNLENYYDQVGRALDVGVRIKVLNEKMDYAGEIVSVLRERLSERHGTFLEWTIIVLISIEVGFEILRLWREGFWDEVFGWEKDDRQAGKDLKIA